MRPRLAANRRLVSWAAAGIFGVALAVGVWRGEALAVLRNALLLCLSCLGLGR
ncbi:MAG TPA: hypothetical protein VGL40_03910 [Bacillota bacterium]